MDVGAIMKRLSSALWLWLLLAGMAVGAKADSGTWYFTGSNTSSLPCSASAPCAEVTITTSGNYATFTVSSLLSNWVIDTFGFNSLKGVTLVPGSLTGELGFYSLGGAGNEDGWGSFSRNFHTGVLGGSRAADCKVTGGIPGPGCTFSFEVKATSALTLANFEILSSGGNGSGYFAGHIASSSRSGYYGTPVQGSIPEPGALLVLVPGLVFAGKRLRHQLFRV